MSEPHDSMVLPAEVLVPFVATGMKKWYRFLILGCNDFHAIRFVKIAARTGPCEIFDF